MTSPEKRPDEWICAGGRSAALEVYDWLKANGVDEWLPERPDICVDAGKLTYTSYVWAGPRGWDLAHVRQAADGSGPVVEDRTVPQLVGVSDRLLELACKTAPPAEFFRLFVEGVEVR